MADIEKVIKAVDNCIHYGCKKCTYYDNGCEKNEMLADVLELLKEQVNEIDEISDEYIDLGKEMAKQPKIVRCKDCINLGYTNSHWFCKWLNRCVDEDWFCADVERKQFAQGE